jgi:hypothetical protein
MQDKLLSIALQTQHFSNLGIGFSIHSQSDLTILTMTDLFCVPHFGSLTSTLFQRTGINTSIADLDDRFTRRNLVKDCIMSDPVNHQTLCRLLKLRVLLAGEGAFRLDPNPKSGSFGALCVLPGTGWNVSLWMEMTTGVVGQISRPNGKPLSKPMVIGNSCEFTSFLHNCDCVAWEQINQLKETHISTIAPAEIIETVNAMILSQDPVVQAWVERLYDNGSTIDLDHEQTDHWAASTETLGLIQNLLHSTDSNMVKAITNFALVCDGKKKSREFSAYSSLDDTSYYVDCLQRTFDADSLPPSTVLHVGDVQWVRITTPAGRAALQFPKRLAPQSQEEKQQNLHQGLAQIFGRIVILTPHRLETNNEYWLLQNESGEHLALAVVADDDLFVCSPQNSKDKCNDIDIFNTYMEAVVALRIDRLGTEGLDEPSPSPRM